jgi:hypothetical protein
VIPGGESAGTPGYDLCVLRRNANASKILVVATVVEVFIVSLTMTLGSLSSPVGKLLSVK